MVSVNNIVVSFGGVPLYEEVSFLINPKDRIGLAGKNGAGKSTLLKILAGHQKPESGEIGKPNQCTIGYLPQEMNHHSGKTVFEETSTAFTELKRIESRIEEITTEISTREDYESDAYMNLLNELNDANERLTLLGGHSIEGQIEQTLLGLGFNRTDFEKSMTQFSGGWRMRVELAKILLQKPNLLLLDEPTNHLDIESIQWLEDFLKNYPGAIVMVSHDKAFLDNITTRTIEISLGKIFDYKANSSKYLQLRKERKEQQLAEAKNQQKYIDKTTDLINKYKAKASKASFAQSLIKKLDKIEVIEVDDEDTSSIKFNFPPVTRSGRVIYEVKNIKKSFGDKLILSGIDFSVERGEKIAFVGKNGEGKSTMLKMLVGDEKYEGEIKLGHNAHVGYYAQNQTELLDEKKTVLQTLDDVAVGEIRTRVRNLLGSFLFSGDAVEKKVKVLSGGEKSRLALCRLLLEPYNVLILDEPTNHLDLRSKEVLKSALNNYEGTLLIVSHDRNFLQGLTGKVFEFRNKSVRQHIGDVYEFLKTRKLESFDELNSPSSKKQATVVEPQKASQEQEDKKQQDKENKKLQNQLNRLEKEISDLEEKVKQFDAKLLDPTQYQQMMNDKESFAAYEKMRVQLAESMKQWEELSLKIEN